MVPVYYKITQITLFLWCRTPLRLWIWWTLLITKLIDNTIQITSKYNTQMIFNYRCNWIRSEEENAVLVDLYGFHMHSLSLSYH